MSTTPPTDRAGRPKAGRWSPSSRISFSGRPEGALVRNVADLDLTSPIQGFGKLWRKTYQVPLDGAALTPEQVVAIWKAEFATFWPRTAHIYGGEEVVTVGDSMLINIGIGPLVLWSTGVVVLYEDDRSFTFMTPERHSFAGWITFSVDRDGAGDAPTATIDVLIRTSDPFYELLMPLGGHRGEDWQWRTVLRNLAARVGAGGARPTMTRICVDHSRQWRYWRNLRANSMVRTTLYSLTHPRRRRRDATGPVGASTSDDSHGPDGARDLERST
ncbi:MAG TPA: hypothetical protein VFZ70_01660 [Euzebyales bacterium]